MNDYGSLKLKYNFLIFHYGFLDKFLNNEAKENGNVYLEWFGDAPSDLVKYAYVGFLCSHGSHYLQYH